jgi:putative oxidoreductase
VSSTPTDISRLLLRLGLGVTFLFTGMQKVLPGTDATVAYFSELGIPWPELLGPLISYLELVGAILLIAGLLTRLVSGLFICEMVVALLVARLGIAGDADSVADAFAAVRLEVLMAIVASCLLLLGGGRWSLDAVVGRLRRHSEAPATDTQHHPG